MSPGLSPTCTPHNSNNVQPCLPLEDMYVCAKGTSCKLRGVNVNFSTREVFRGSGILDSQMDLVLWMPCVWSPRGLDEEMERADGEAGREFSGAHESCPTLEVGKADGPSCLT